MRNHLYLTNKSEAIGWLNKWGTDYTPFLFIIDFEMKKIRVFRLDKDLPSWVRYDFNGYLNQRFKGVKNKIDFQKSPIPFNEYEPAFKLVSQHIQAGNSFLVNLTMPTPVETGLTFADLYLMSHARYKLWLEDEFICFSPEPFVRISKGKISTYPMKGTIAGNLPNAEEIILSDKKETAEHHTVIDLLRNDLSMVAKNVVIERYRYIDKIKTHEGDILQVSSEISGQLDNDWNRKIGDILFALLPAGSVTGAPKIKTVEIIRQAEKADRGYYTGICGIFDGESIDSSVMIRFIEWRNGRMIYRSGGGITFLSNAQNEYEELISKVYVPVA